MNSFLPFKSNGSSSSLKSASSSTSSPRFRNSPSQGKRDCHIKVGTVVNIEYSLPTSSINIQDLGSQIRKETNEKEKGKAIDERKDMVIKGFIHAYDVQSELLFVQEITTEEMQTLMSEYEQNKKSTSPSNTSNNKGNRQKKKIEFKFTRNSANIVAISRQAIKSMQRIMEVDDVFIQFPPLLEQPNEIIEKQIQEQIATLKELENKKMNDVKLDVDDRANMIFDFLVNLYSTSVAWSNKPNSNTTESNVNTNNKSTSKSPIPGEHIDNSKLSIVVMDSVCIDHPYDSSSVRFINGGNNNDLLQRICKIINDKHWDKAAKFR